MDIFDIAPIAIAFAAVGAAMVWWFAVRPNNQRSAQAFGVLAEALGCTVEVKNEFDRRFRITVQDHNFTVAAYYASGRGAGSVGSMGTAGDYLVTSTPLKPALWKLQVIEVRVGPWRRPAGSNMVQKRSGDDVFDRAFGVSELGDSLPSGWLNDSVRKHLRLVFESPTEPVALAVEDGVLIQHGAWSTNGVAPQAFQDSLCRLAALAEALGNAARPATGQANQAAAQAVQAP